MPTDTPLLPALGRAIDARMTKRFPGDEIHSAHARMEAASQLVAARKAQDAAEVIGGVAMGSQTSEYLVVALWSEHPTILAQIGRAVAEAIVAQCYDTDGWTKLCTDMPGLAEHPRHDGRYTCRSIVAASILANQPLI